MSATRRPEGRQPGDREPAGRGPAADGEYARLDDTTLISLRKQVREQLEREPANMAELVRAHHRLTVEIVRRTLALRRQGG